MPSLDDRDLDRIIDQQEADADRAARLGTADEPADEPDATDAGPAEPAGTLRDKMATAVADLPGDGDDAAAIDFVDEVQPADETATPSVRDRFVSDYGLEGYDRYGSDDEAVSALADEHRRLIDYVTGLQQPGATPPVQAAPVAPPVEPEGPAYWDSPKFNPDWMRQVEFDPEVGVYRHKIGRGTPDIAAKVNEYHGFLEQQQKEFWSNPFDYIREFVQDTARKAAEETDVVSRAADGRREEAAGFIRQNEEWLFARDAEGKVAIDPRTNRQKLSQEGLAFSQVVAELEQNQIPAHLQGPIAKTMIENDRLRTQVVAKEKQASAADTTGDAESQRTQKNADILKNAARRSTGRGGTVRRQNGRPKPQSQNASMGIRQRLREATQAAGFRGDENAKM